MSVTVLRRGTPWRLRWLGGICIVAVLAGCNRRGPTVSPADAAIVLATVAGPLPEGLEVLCYESRGGGAASWIVRTATPWRPHESVDHRHATLPTDTFMNLVTATAQGRVDPGRPAENSCRYTEWQASAADAAGRRDIRIFQLGTDRGELTVLEMIPDPAGG